MATRPNILIIWGDDIGISNLSCYSDGLMGYRTPNIDRIADEGVRFTDYYGEQSCTAGRAAFITGQNPYRTGLTKVGHARSPTSACGPRTRRSPPRSRRSGYATGQFGKNHFGDRDEFLPTDARLRRVLRQPLPPQRRGGARARRLPDRGGVPGLPQELRAARRHPLVGQRRRHAAHRGHRPADQGADEDHRRRVRARGAAVHGRRQGRRTRRSSCGSTPPTCTSAPTSRTAAAARPAGGSRSTTTRWSTTTSSSGRCSTSSTSWASPTTRSSCTPPTTGRT